jgi:hypothetical protein
VTIVDMHKRLRCRCHHHHAGEQGTGDDAKASLAALLPSLTCTVVIASHPRHPPTAFHCHHQPLLIVEYVLCRLWNLSSCHQPPISINIPLKCLLVHTLNL